MPKLGRTPGRSGGADFLAKALRQEPSSDPTSRLNQETGRKINFSSNEET
jgi:hypothetical protein